MGGLLGMVLAWHKKISTVILCGRYVCATSQQSWIYALCVGICFIYVLWLHADKELSSCSPFLSPGAFPPCYNFFVSWLEDMRAHRIEQLDSLLGAQKIMAKGIPRIQGPQWCRMRWRWYAHSCSVALMPSMRRKQAEFKSVWLKKNLAVWRTACVWKKYLYAKLAAHWRFWCEKTTV